MQPRELQSISRVTARADSLSVISPLLEFTLLILATHNYFKFLHSYSLTAMCRNPFLDSSATESDVFYVESSSKERSFIRNNTPAVLNSTELSRAMETETITISSVASLEPQIVKTLTNSHFYTGSVIKIQLCHPTSMISTCRKTTSMGCLLWPWFDKTKNTAPNYPDLYPISTPPMNLSTIDDWETPHTTTGDNTFYSEGEHRRVYWDISPSEIFDSNEPRQAPLESSPSSTPPSPPRQKRKLSKGMSFPEMWWVSQHTCEVSDCFYQPQRHPNAQGRTQTLILLIRLLTNYSWTIFKHCTHMRIRIGYVSQTST